MKSVVVDQVRQKMSLWTATMSKSDFKHRRIAPTVQPVLALEAWRSWAWRAPVGPL